MSVLIKGMEMPTSCVNCRFSGFGGLRNERVVCMHTGSNAYMNEVKYLDDCPLVPVPPHGDLIDRDAILKAYGLSTSKVDCSGCKYKNEVRCEKYELCEALNDAPTIIEAEEGE